MKIFRLSSFQDYKKHTVRNADNYRTMEEYESSITKEGLREFVVTAISYPANQIVDLQVDYQYGDGVHINWRERLICPVTGLNNRLRASIQVLDLELSPYPDSKIYINEQLTPLFTFLKNRCPQIIGSEFLGANYQSGQIIDGIRHEDMRNLSFADESLDLYLSFECFEHVPFYENAIPEIYRTLKPGGSFLGTFPFDVNAQDNFIKAKLDENGEITYLTEPEYHGDPVNGKGILCYTVFGWEMLDQFRNAGFSEVCVLLIWSDVYGYLGGEQLFFVAKKSTESL